MSKAFVLLSGGLDSTTLLYKAVNEFDEVEAIGIDYGQRHKKETDYAQLSCNKLNVSYTVLPIHGLSGDDVMLTDDSVDIPDVTYDEIEGVSPTFVPFRNGTMLSHVAAHAQKWVMSKVSELEGQTISLGDDVKVHTSQSALESMKDSATIICGIHSEDAENWAYPDCTPEFYGAMAGAIYMGTYSTVRLAAPALFLTKGELVSMGHKLGLPYEDTWSCYKGEENHCGACPTCYARIEAFKEAGVPDPTKYK